MTSALAFPHVQSKGWWGETVILGHQGQNVTLRDWHAQQWVLRYKAKHFRVFALHVSSFFFFFFFFFFSSPVFRLGAPLLPHSPTLSGLFVSPPPFLIHVRFGFVCPVYLIHSGLFGHSHICGLIGIQPVYSVVIIYSCTLYLPYILVIFKLTVPCINELFIH